MLRFDHREIAVVFSLFIFVSLLMFTVGILVGKGLTQAKFEGNGALSRLKMLPEDSNHPATEASLGFSPTSPGESAPLAVKPRVSERDTASVPSERAPEEVAPLELIPQKSNLKAFTGGSLREPKISKEAARAMNDPKIQRLLEDDPAYRKQQAIAAGRIPASADKGAYTVQIGSYPSEKAAAERVEQVKKLGFPHAYFNVKEMGDPKKKWFRVCLGYFSNGDNAEISGQILQRRGEVKNYIVRKSDTSG